MGSFRRRHSEASIIPEIHGLGYLTPTNHRIPFTPVKLTCSLYCYSLSSQCTFQLLLKLSFISEANDFYKAELRSLSCFKVKIKPHLYSGRFFPNWSAYAHLQLPEVHVQASFSFPYRQKNIRIYWEGK